MGIECDGKNYLSGCETSLAKERMITVRFFQGARYKVKLGRIITAGKTSVVNSHNPNLFL